MDQQHWQCQGLHYKCKFSGLTPDELEIKICILTRLPGDTCASQFRSAVEVIEEEGGDLEAALCYGLNVHGPHPHFHILKS